MPEFILTKYIQMLAAGSRGLLVSGALQYPQFIKIPLVSTRTSFLLCGSSQSCYVNLTYPPDILADFHHKHP